MSRCAREILPPVAVAAVFWFLMFSPWTAPFVPLWPTLSAAATLLLVWAFRAGRPWPAVCRRWALEGVLGVAVAAALWGVFFVGDRVSRELFDFARPQVDAVYRLGGATPRAVLAVLLLCVIGPAEEIFWRGFVQRRLSARWGVWRGFALATALYALIHVSALNVMLLGAALVCGVAWGALYALWPRHFPAWILSHALWDAAAFVFLPF